MGTYFVATVQYQPSMLGGNVAGSAHYYCCQLSFCWLVACQYCGPLQLHWGMSSSWGESKKCFEAQDVIIFLGGLWNKVYWNPIFAGPLRTPHLLRHTKKASPATPHHPKGNANQTSQRNGIRSRFSYELLQWFSRGEKGRWRCRRRPAAGSSSRCHQKWRGRQDRFAQADGTEEDEYHDDYWWACGENGKWCHGLSSLLIDIILVVRVQLFYF